MLMYDFKMLPVNAKVFCVHDGERIEGFKSGSDQISWRDGYVQKLDKHATRQGEIERAASLRYVWAI